jgi:hypothetical protein
MPYNNVLVDCHGTKIRGAPVQIPEYMSVISFSVENEFSDQTHIGMFKLMCLKDDTFIHKFTYVLSIFGSSLYNMDILELIKNCEEFNIRYSLKDYNNILKVIKSGGLNRFFSQNITYHGPGSILSNYKLSYKLYEKINVLVKSDPLEVRISPLSLTKEWKGGDKMYYIKSGQSPDYDVTITYRLGIFNDMNKITLMDGMMTKVGNLSLRQVINTFDTYNKGTPTILFLNFCKVEDSQPSILQQIQPRRVQPLTLLSGLNFQLKSPAKIKKVRKSKLHNHKAV